MPEVATAKLMLVELGAVRVIGAEPLTDPTPAFAVRAMLDAARIPPPATPAVMLPLPPLIPTNELAAIVLLFRTAVPDWARITPPVLLMFTGPLLTTCPSMVSGPATVPFMVSGLPEVSESVTPPAPALVSELELFMPPSTRIPPGGSLIVTLPPLLPAPKPFALIAPLTVAPVVPVTVTLPPVPPEPELVALVVIAPPTDAKPLEVLTVTFPPVPPEPVVVPLVLIAPETEAFPVELVTVTVPPFATAAPLPLAVIEPEIDAAPFAAVAMKLPPPAADVVSTFPVTVTDPAEFSVKLCPKVEMFVSGPDNWMLLPEPPLVVKTTFGAVEAIPELALIVIDPAVIVLMMMPCAVTAMLPEVALMKLTPALPLAALIVKLCAPRVVVVPAPE